MSYLSLNGNLSGLAKSTISFWFRVPQATGAAANSSYNADDLDSVLNGLIPFITWDCVSPYTDEGPNGPNQQGTIGPSFIGVFAGYFAGELANLAIRFQSPNMSTRYYGKPINVDTLSSGNFYAIGASAGIHTYSSDSQIDLSVTMDEWHHLLLSFDVSGPRGSMWIAFDDVNKDGSYLWPAAPYCMGLFGFSGGLNEIAATFDWPIYSTGGFSVASGGFSMPTTSFGVPISAQWVGKSNGAVEMAELQIFTGVTVDTNDTNTRRAFIDQNGKPVPPDKKKSATDPQSGSIELMGKKPDVLLHSSSNWKQGRNTGSGGQLTPTGEIKSYKPNPSLRGPQG